MSNYDKQEWRNSGSSCCSPFGLCCLSWFCPCIVAGKTHHRLKVGPSMEGYSACNGHCCLHFGTGLLGFHWVVQMMQRGEVRNKYNLTGNGCKDCLCACFCTPCDLMQVEKETKEREEEHLISKQPEAVNQMQYGAPVRH